MSKKKTRITLSPFGRRLESPKPEISKGLAESVGTPTPAPTPTPTPAVFDWKNALIDSFIICMITFFTTLGGVTAAGADLKIVLISAAISAVAQFFVMLAVKRGLQLPSH